MRINNLSTERSVSLVIAGDSRREPDSLTEPAWITIARQKQWGTQQEQELDGEKPVTPDTKSDTEKQNKEKERTEVLTVQICDDFILLHFRNIPLIHCCFTTQMP